MKKIFMAFAVVALTTACNEMEVLESSSNFMVTGYNETNGDSRTAFDTPNKTAIPFLWSEGDYIWLGTTQSDAISAGCQIANFTFSNGSAAVVGTGHVFYNKTSTNKNAYVLATQTADGNLGNDGDFGYAVLDEFNSFCLKHKTSYLWFDTTTEDADMPKLTSITVDADGVNIAGKQTYDYQNNVWNTTVTEGSSTITLNFAEGHTLVSENSGVMAAMVCLPAVVRGKTLTITYSFDDGSTFTETKKPNSDFVAGATLRIQTSIAKNNLVKEPVLRVLTFEDGSQNWNSYSFNTYSLSNGSSEFSKEYQITKWSDLIPTADYGDDMIYSAPDPTYYSFNGKSEYYWYDSDNTMLKHVFPKQSGMDWNTFETYDYYNYQASGHALSASYTTTVVSSESFEKERYVYGTSAHSGTNFCVHHGYMDEWKANNGSQTNLPMLEFGDGLARVIDHMYVNNTVYTYNKLVNGENAFGGTFQPTDEGIFKIVAKGYKTTNDENPTTVEFKLRDEQKNVVSEWTKWDLTGLGEVVKVEFNLVGSNTMIGDYGLIIPAYFAYDDIAVQF